MSDIANSSRIVATDLRKAEKSIEMAQRDLLYFMLTATEANIACGLSPDMAQRVMKPAIAALTSLSASQDRLTGDTHAAALGIARRLRLDVTDYGAGDPKPAPSVIFTGASAQPEQLVAASA